MIIQILEKKEVKILYEALLQFVDISVINKLYNYSVILLNLSRSTILYGYRIQNMNIQDIFFIVKRKYQTFLYSFKYLSILPPKTFLTIEIHFSAFSSYDKKYNLTITIE